MQHSLEIAGKMWQIFSMMCHWVPFCQLNSSFAIFFQISFFEQPYLVIWLQINSIFRPLPVPMLPSGLTIPAPQSRVQVRALYTHSGAGDSQLSFVAGDCVTLVGEEKEGWQYGENSRTRRYGYGKTCSFVQM